MPSPIIHSWLPASFALISDAGKGLSKKEKMRLLIAGVILSNSPDWDFIPGLIWMDHLNEIHRNWGHNIFSIVVLIFLGKKGLEKFVSAPFFKGKQGWLFASFFVGSHLFLDSLGHYTNTEFSPHIPLLFPFSDYRLTLPLKLFATIAPQAPINLFSFEFIRWWFLGELIPSIALFLFFYTVLLASKSKLIAPLKFPIQVKVE